MEMFVIDLQIGKTAVMVLAVLLGWLIWIPVGAYVARQKRRSMMEGTLLGCLGPVGALIAALLPTQPPQDL